MLFFFVVFLGWGSDGTDEWTSVATGQAARESIERERSGNISKSATDFYYWDEGFLSDHTTYWSFRCRSIQECRDASHSFDALQDWVQPSFPFIMQGPAYFGKKHETDRWSLESIQRGGFVLDLDYHKERYSLLQFTAIDYDTLRVYRMRWYGDSLTTVLNELGYDDSLQNAKPTDEREPE